MQFSPTNQPPLAERGRCRPAATGWSVVTVYRTVGPVTGAYICGVLPRQGAGEPAAAAGDSTFHSTPDAKNGELTIFRGNGSYLGGHALARGIDMRRADAPACHCLLRFCHHWVREGGLHHG